MRAQEGSGTPPPPKQESSADDERRLEALEAAARARKGVKAEQADAFRGSRPAQVGVGFACGLVAARESFSGGCMGQQTASSAPQKVL